MNLIRGVSDQNVVFLDEVKWEGMQQKVRQGRLSNETLFGLKHTVLTFTKLIKYLFD